MASWQLSARSFYDFEVNIKEINQLIDIGLNIYSKYLI